MAAKGDTKVMRLLNEDPSVSTRKSPAELEYPMVVHITVSQRLSKKVMLN